MFTTRNFSIPTGGWNEKGSVRHLHEPDEQQNRLKPKLHQVVSKVTVVPRVGNHVVTVHGKLPTCTFTEAHSVADAASQLLHVHCGAAFEESQSILVGYFTQGYGGEKPLPKHHLVLCVMDQSTISLRESCALVSPYAELGFERLLLTILMELQPGDEIGWGDPDKNELPLQIWRGKRQIKRAREQAAA